MYDKLINGVEASAQYKSGVAVQFVRRGVWQDMTESNTHLLRSEVCHVVTLT